MDRIMRWCVPDDALHKGVDWVALHPELWMGKEYSTETLNQNYFDVHGIYAVGKPISQEAVIRDLIEAHRWR